MPKTADNVVEAIAAVMRNTISGLQAFGISTGSFRPHDGLLKARGLYESLEWNEEQLLHERYPLTMRAVSSEAIRIQAINALAEELGLRVY